MARRTPLYELHRQAGARFTEFSGWEMPVQYTGIIAEHHQVRSSAGLFDVSHMGELEIRGAGALALCQRVATNDASRLAVGQAQYTVWCADDGGTIDDTILYRLGDQRYMFCVNAGNAETCRDWIREQQKHVPGADVVDRCDELGLIALQGPRAADVARRAQGAALPDLARFACAETTVAGIPVIAARTGYTGEDGFELFVAWDDGPPAWEALLAAGAERGLVPCGLGARDTLRLEAGMPLYGNELDRGCTPFEAGLGRVVRMDRPGDFTGRAELEAAAAAPRKRLVGLELRDRGIARHGYPVHEPGAAEPCGVVTSGTLSPTLERAIAMAYVPPGRSEVGTMLEVGIRSSRVPAQVVPLPFYRRPA